MRSWQVFWLIPLLGPAVTLLTEPVSVTVNGGGDWERRWGRDLRPVELLAAGKARPAVGSKEVRLDLALSTARYLASRLL